MPTETDNVDDLLDEQSDVIAYINNLFPDEQSLANIDEVIEKIKMKIKHHDEEISSVVRSQSLIERDGRDALDKASNVIEELMKRILDMKCQARKSEQTVSEITGDIKQLDNAKRNLTSTVIMLNNLQILVESVDKLRDVNERHEYKQAASTLASVKDILDQFDSYKHIPQIRELSEQTDEICNNLSSRILIDFKRSFEVPSAKQSLSQTEVKLLSEACQVVSILGIELKDTLIAWFLDLQLREYHALFQDSLTQMSSLGNVDKRYSWLKKHLQDFEERYGFIFPSSWKMSECMAIEFCKITKKSLTRIMNARPSDINLRLLMFAITKTTAFETLLARRFGCDLVSGMDSLNPFLRIISECFEPFLHIYIEAQDQTLGELMSNFVEDHQSLTKSSVEQKSVTVFLSSNKLFSQYKNCLVQCLQLSTRQTLLDLTNLFKKYLREYACRVLQSHLRTSSANQTSGSSSLTNRLTSIESNTSSMFSAATSGAAGLLQSLLREDAGRSRVDSAQICRVILTSDYCSETTEQLEKKLKEKIEPSLESSIDMKPELDVFTELCNGCIHLLLQNIEASCEPGFTSMVKIQWSSVGTPVGHSRYIDEIMSGLQEQFPLIRDYLLDSRKYFVQLCNQFITIFTPKFISNLYRCKPLSQNGAEQLLLDTHTLKKFLLRLPCIQSDIKSAPASYTKAVVKGMTKAETILKIVLVPHNQPESFIESYIKLMPESNSVEFQRILEVKGVKRSESNALLDVYNKVCQASTST